MTKSRSRAVILPTALAALALSCGGESDKNRIVPLLASIEIQPVSAAPVVFLRERAVSGDIVFLDVLLRSGVPLTYDAFAFSLRFDPSVLHVGVLKEGGSTGLSDPDATPFGDCGEGDPAFCATTISSPLCVDNTDPGSADYANDTGTLVLGVAATTGIIRQDVCSGGPTPGALCDEDMDCAGGTCVEQMVPACSDATAAGEVRLLTLALTAVSVGESTIEFLPKAQLSGNCEILDDGMDLDVPCDAGMAVFRASR